MTRRGGEEREKVKREKWVGLCRKMRTGVDGMCFFWDFSVITLSLWINPASLL